MKTKERQFHVLLSTSENVVVNIGTAQIHSSVCKELLELK